MEHVFLHFTNFQLFLHLSKWLINSYSFNLDFLVLLLCAGVSQGVSESNFISTDAHFFPVWFNYSWLY